MTDTEVLRLAAFTTEPTAGNPAGVVLDAAVLSEEQMLAIARDVGYSETAFLTDRLATDGDAPAYRIRYFSPGAEVDFCGHATIATGVALAERGSGPLVRLQTNNGPVDVTTEQDGDRVLAELTSVPAWSRDLAEDQARELLSALRLSADDLDPQHPLGLAYAGNQHPVVPLRSRERLAALDYDYPAAEALMARERWTTLQVVRIESARVVHSRNPFPPGGVREDPATGAAAAALGAYLRDRGVVPRPAELVVHQGVDMGSPSTIRVRVPATGEAIQVAGTAVRIDDTAGG